MIIEILLAIVLVLLTAILGLLLLNKMKKNSTIIPKVYIINEELIENDKLKLNDLSPKTITEKTENIQVESKKEEIPNNKVEKKDKEKTSEEIKTELKNDIKDNSNEIPEEKTVLQTKDKIVNDVKDDIESEEEKSIEESE